MNSDEWVNGYSAWIKERAEAGNDVVYINIMFRHMGTMDVLLRRRMEYAIGKFYGQLCTRFVSDPRRPSAQEHLPIVVLVPDRPVPKKNGKLQGDPMVNGGLHYNGFGMAPPYTRFKEDLASHLNHRRYLRRGIERIHAEPVKDFERIGSYVFKTLLRRRASPDDILVYPKPVSSLEWPAAVESVDRRETRDILSRTNLSAELLAALPLAKSNWR